VTVVHRRSTKRPLHQNALDAYLKGELHPFGRATTIRPESDYEQDLSVADHLMPTSRFGGVAEDTDDEPDDFYNWHDEPRQGTSSFAASPG